MARREKRAQLVLWPTADQLQSMVMRSHPLAEVSQGRFISLQWRNQLHLLAARHVRLSAQPRSQNDAMSQTRHAPPPPPNQLSNRKFTFEAMVMTSQAHEKQQQLVMICQKQKLTSGDDNILCSSQGWKGGNEKKKSFITQ